jgi:23S rRNA pseudouridine1911/1915/1917 synthase
MTDDRRELSIPEDLAGQRFDKALARMFPQYSRSRLQDWIAQGFVTVDGGPMRPKDAVRGGERVVLQPQATPSVTSEPEAMPLHVVFEDGELLIVNKPAGLVVHPGAGNIRGTLMNGLLHRVPGLAELPRAGIVHRLDKETSGLLLVAKTLESHAVLVRLMGERAIARHYRAICNGVLTGGGTIDAPIGRHPVDRLKMAVRENGKPAVTHYRVVKRFAAHTYISVQLESGRTHQIRVHLAHRRHPLLGDPVYGGRLAIPGGANEHLQSLLRSFRRQALHAARLEFAYRGIPMQFEAPLPADFAELLEALEGGTG